MLCCSRRDVHLVPSANVSSDVNVPDRRERGAPRTCPRTWRRGRSVSQTPEAESGCNGRHRKLDDPKVADQTKIQELNMAGNADDMITLTGAEHDPSDPDLSAATTPDAEDLVITSNSETGVYEASIGGRTAAGLVYNTVGNRVTLMATSVLPEFRGKGVAGRLISAVLDELRTQGKTATVTCPFTAAFVNAHPEYADVLDPAFPGAYITRHRSQH
jgi:predicted GNAT family acetyltransferase